MDFDVLMIQYYNSYGIERVKTFYVKNETLDSIFDILDKFNHSGEGKVFHVELF